MKLEELIGNTPLAELSRIKSNKNVIIYGKLEGDNPGGSVKDRAAYWMIKEAINRGDIDNKTTLIEATSGNTGIALAMIARLFDINLELVMPENLSKERVLSMEAYGAKVILTSKKNGMEGARDYVSNKLKTGKYHMLDQFSNPDNTKAHYETTGPEIWRDTKGKITHFVSAMGTTGTIMGVSKFLKEKNPNIQIIGVQPSECSTIPGIRKWPEEYLPKIYNPTQIDRVIEVTEKEAISTTRQLAQTEGIMAGMSSGGALCAALKLSKELDKGIIVFIICDRGDRYLSTNLFRD